MIKRLIETRPTLNEILEELGIDTLLSSEWTKLENLMKLLEPFATHTDQLQTDSQSLSEVVPALLNLEAHLQQTTNMEKQTVQVLLRSMRQRFAGILDPTHAKFDPTAGAASLMDPSVSLALTSPEMQHLKREAEIFVLDQALRYSQTSATMTDNACELSSTSGGTNKTLQKYSFLATKIFSTTNQVNPVDNSGSAVHEMQKYLDEVKRDNIGVRPLEYWQRRVAVYPKLAPVAIDFVSAPASQAFVERIFSVCGQLSSGLRNRMTTSLDQRVFLKVNRKFCY